MTSAGSGNYEDHGVFDLLTELCDKTASNYSSHSGISQKCLVAKMRSHSYEIILRKTPKEIPAPKGEPMVDLLSLYFVSQQSYKNVAEYKRSLLLKRIISTIRQTDFGEKKENIYNILRLLFGLSNAVKEDLSKEMFESPFSFGLSFEMLPKPKPEAFGSPEPYSYFPSYVFELPFSLTRQVNMLDKQKSQTYTEYTVESFDSRSLLPDVKFSKMGGVSEVKTFHSPMSLPSLISDIVSPYSGSAMLYYPRLTVPRDLQIPLSQSGCVKISLPSLNSKGEVREMFRGNLEEESIDIWEIASQVDKDIPNDIWEMVSKLPPIIERQLIASSSREITLWRRLYKDEFTELNIISEKQFISHIMYLIIGIETSSFPFCQESNCFYMKYNLVLEGISRPHLGGYVKSLLLIGTYYRRLFKFAFNQTLDDHFHSKGLVYEATREVVRVYLLEFRLLATEIYKESYKNTENINCMPTLLEILHHMEPLKYEIETIASIYKMSDPGPRTSIPMGAELMSYLFNEISLVTHTRTAFTMFNSLFSVCKVYFKFIERFIFEGELDDKYQEFFIRKDLQYVNYRSKRYWDKGFHITQSVTVPDFLRPMVKFILLCGKSLRLLKLCNPSDPLVLLISSDHPSVKCCASFEDLERQQQLLDVYRTRCLFVSGEPATFDQILLKREAEKKAFTEMASLKQAETMEKIVAERKRLAQLIIAEKQHSLRVLEAAMAETKAAKSRAKKRERKLHEVEQAADKATEEVDAKIKDDERNKIMEYYSKLNIEVEKSKIHTEWKIKRLQLDQSRIQLLSTEERNLKREKLELQHQRNEEIMAMSIQSLDAKTDVETDAKDRDDNSNNEVEIKALDFELSDSKQNSEYLINKTKSHTSTDVFSAICNAAKSIFGVSKSSGNKNCENNKALDAQGNVLTLDSEGNSKENDTQYDKNSDEYGNLEYLKLRQEAILNKQKVLGHEFGQIDKENNEMKDPPLIPSVDEENNFEVFSPFTEAKRNRLKVLGTEFNVVKPESKYVEPVTDAQKEALINKRKVLGVEYNLPVEFVATKEPITAAQEEALKNKSKILGSDVMSSEKLSTRHDKRAGLKLNLKSCSETILSASLTPNPVSVTPGELFPRLDLETPTTADLPLEGAITSDAFTPRNEEKSIESGKPSKEFLTSEGFDFSVIVDNETAEAEVMSDIQAEDSPHNSPSKYAISKAKGLTCKPAVNPIDGSYRLVDFDPFGIKYGDKYTGDHYNNKMDDDMASSCYTHPAVIMAEVKKKPYSNIFAPNFTSEVDDEQKITCDNIATLTACLQRSVMLPMTYQLEVVNNSILTYFLVNLEMYEHLRSLKDYFFLMDGEFSKSICHNLFAKLDKTLNPQELLNFATLHNILDKALGSSISHIHKFSENLSFLLTESPLSFHHSSPDVLQCLSLTYSVSWPLNIILSQEALLRYAKVFQFLIKMRRIFWVLGEDFESLKLSTKLSNKHSRILLHSPQYISIQIHRHVMASLIRALDNYIVTTCILSSWTEFENDLKKARTLDDLYDCHVAYIKKVLFRCLLNNRSTLVMKLLNDIFTVILKFSRVLKAGEWKQNEANSHFVHTNFAQLEELFHLFEKLAKYLHKVVIKLMDCGYQRHLVELLTMVNFNGYYNSDKSKEHNSSVQST